MAKDMCQLGSLALLTLSNSAPQRPTPSSDMGHQVVARSNSSRAMPTHNENAPTTPSHHRPQITGQFIQPSLSGRAVMRLLANPIDAYTAIGRLTSVANKMAVTLIAFFMISNY